MDALVTISLASESDLPDISPISGHAMRDDLLDPFLFGFGRPPAVPEAFFGKIIRANIQDPRFRVFKAILQTTGEVVGYGKATIV